ncbi:MAG: chromate transporter [Clostridia bacterium]|nr:chromate transporter [Clostridia bacterium]
MILLELFLCFLKVGCFAFGGAYAAIPIVRETVLGYGWLTDEALSRMIAVGESTPGPIMVNLATYVGVDRGGILGGAVATFAVVLPAFLIIVLILAVFKRLAEKPVVKALLTGLKSCVTGIILAVGVYMVICGAFPTESGRGFDLSAPELPAILITAALGAVMIGYRLIRKKRLSPILLIVIAAALGMAVYGV